MIADFQVAHAGTDLLHDARALVPADDGHWNSGEVAGADMVIGVAKPSGFERHLDLTLLGSVEIDLLDAPVLVHVP